MFDNVNLYKPDRIIRCSSLKEAGEVYEFMSSMGAKDYAYGLAYMPPDELRVHYLKIGKSSPAAVRVNAKIFGERIVRQIAHLDGWKKKAISGHGVDFSMGVRNLIAEGKLDERALHRDNIVIGIWNANPNFRTCLVEATVQEQVSWLEGNLCQQYKNDFKLVLPLLNKQDPSNSEVMSRTWVNRIIDPAMFAF